MEVTQWNVQEIYTLFNKNVVFPAQAEYSYFSADFRLKIFLWHFRFRMYCGINNKCSVSRSVSRYIACSRRSDSRARANKGSETAGKKEGRLGKRTSPLPRSPLVFFSCSFARVIFRSRSTIWTPGTGYALHCPRAPWGHRFSCMTCTVHQAVISIAVQFFFRFVG